MQTSLLKNRRIHLKLYCYHYLQVCYKLGVVTTAIRISSWTNEAIVSYTVILVSYFIYNDCPGLHLGPVSHHPLHYYSKLGQHKTINLKSSCLLSLRSNWNWSKGRWLNIFVAMTENYYNRNLSTIRWSIIHNKYKSICPIHVP